MSTEPRIVAELGRPETPDETAARKAESSRKHYANQTFTNLLLALAASLIIVLVLVLVVLRPDPPAPEPIDYRSLAAEASPTVDETLLAPALPDGWSANAAELRRGAGDVVAWYAGFVTPGEEFVSLTQGIDANPTWLAATLDEASPTGSLPIDGIDWTIYDQRDDASAGNLEYAMSAVVGSSTIVLGGTAGDAEFMAFAEAVSGDAASAAAEDTGLDGQSP